MITNQLHDLHATGASLTAEARIIAEALAGDSCIRTANELIAEAGGKLPHDII